MNATLRTGLVLLTIMLAVARAAAAEDPIGSARVIVAAVSAQSAAESRPLQVSDQVRYQEMIATEDQSAAVITFLDDTELAIGANAQVRLDAFVFDPGAAGRLELDVELGALRFSTGQMDKSAYRIKTPSAVLTVRGTEFGLAVDDDGAIYVEVRSGEVLITTANGESRSVAVNQSVSVNAAGVPGQVAAALSSGVLPDKIAAMDDVLADALAGSPDPSLSDLDVLAKARSLNGARPDPGRPDRPDKSDKDKKAGKG